MTIGIVLFSWDKKMGPIVDIKYPENYNISNALINKIYMTHAYDQKTMDEELIEINYSDQIILSYCDKKRVPIVGYEIIILILHERERVNVYKSKIKLLNFAKNLFQKPKEERKQIFLGNIKAFFQEQTTKKILLLGRAGTGKTSIKKIVFEGKSSKELLYSPLKPTRGITPSVYSWLDLRLGLFDSAGQELSFLLNDESEQSIAFEQTDVVIYLFDFPMWVAKQQEILKEIQAILNIIKAKSFGTKTILFLHKIDLIDQETRDSIIEDLRNLIQEKLNLPIFFTSIYPGLIYNTYNAFQEILSSFSEETSFVKRELDVIFKDLNKTMCFFTNQNDSIIIQAMTRDFEPTIINHAHKLIAQLTQSFKDMTSSEDIKHLILSGSNNLNIIMKSLNFAKFNLKNLACISKSLSANKLIWLAGEIRMILNDIYYIKKKKRRIK